jgi:putative hemolysin
MDAALLIFLILLNGLFAMSEMALTASRKTRLLVMVEAGDASAQYAMALAERPTQFLSTVQIGITSIGVLNGIVGEAAFSDPVAHWLEGRLPMVTSRVADIAATALVVIAITLVTIIFGELVPKRIGQMHPESVARLVAQPMTWISRLASPFVYLLSATTHGVLKLIGISDNGNRSVTEEEIAASLEEGLDAGVIEAHEHQMVRNVFRLDDRQIGSMMIPRSDIAWLDLHASAEQILAVVAARGHSRYPVCRDSLDDVLGVITSQQLLAQLATAVVGTEAGSGAAPGPSLRPDLAEPGNGHGPAGPVGDSDAANANGGPVFAVAKAMQPAVFVPETLTGMELLEHFRGSSVQMVFVVDEYGVVQGVITLRDVLEAITGEFTTASEGDSWAVQRADGSWLIDGLIPVPELKDRLELKELPDEDRGRYNTLAGMIMLLLGRLPQTTDIVEWGQWRFEVVDLDGKRVDKVLASYLPESTTEPESPAK